MCQVVLALLVIGGLSAALSGCYDMHQGSGTDAGRAIDAPLLVTPPDGSPPWDASSFVRIDAPSPPDAALTCPVVRPDASCLESFAIPAGVASALPYQFDGCGCCVDTACVVEVDEAARTLRLTTTLCPDPCDCDACVIPRGTCEVPPLRALGEWTVETNGTAAFTIGVVEVSDPTFAPAPPGCATYAEIDECGGARPDFSTGPVHGSVCRTLSRDGASRQVLRLTEDCGSCGDVDSSCEVILAPRLTDDLPPGGEITLHAAHYGTACDVDCPDLCIRHERECELPPLVSGDFYRVYVDGEVVLSFVGGEPMTPCEAP